MPEVSIIIRTYNEERHLPALFDAIGRQRFRDFEVVVVDSGSLDRTREIAVERNARLIRISKHDFTFGYSLNTGIENAAGEYIVMVSAHTEPSTADWLENLVAPLRDPNVAMSFGRQLGVAASKFSEAEDFRRIFGTQSLDLSPPDFFANNANSAVRKDLWEAYPFDEKLTGLEDIDFAKYWMERGYRVRYVADAPLYHIHEETWKQVQNRYFREAVAARRIGLTGRRHLPREIAREALWSFADLSRALAPQDNPAAARLSLTGRIAEISRFRYNKLTGVVRGLLQSHPLETRQQQEELLFDRGARAVRIHAPGHARLETVAVPDTKPGDALIRVSHVAVCATDLEIAAGTLGYFKDGLASYPIVPGHEFSGRIVKVGQNVTGLAEGDPVVVECIQSCGNCVECRNENFIGCDERAELGVLRRDGAYADYVSVPARHVHKLPADADLRKATLTEPTAVVLKGLRKLEPLLKSSNGGKLKIGVVGAGPLGQLCARILAFKNYQVLAFDRAAERLAFLDGSGIEATTDLTRVGECQAIVELSGNADALDAVLRGSQAGTAILLLGFPYGEKPFSFEGIVAFDKAIVGSVGSAAADFRSAIALLEELPISAHLGHRFALEEFDTAWKASRLPTVLKAIIDVDAEHAEGA